MLTKAIKNPNETPYLDWIKSGVKCYEGRLFEKIVDWNLNVGGKIMFYDENNDDSYVACEITELLIYKDFGCAYDALGDMLIPNSNKDDVITLYNKLFDPNYENLSVGESSSIIKRHGVVCIGIKIIFQN